MNEEVASDLDFRIASEKEIFISAGTLTDLIIVAGQPGVQAEAQDTLVRIGVQVLEVTEARARAAGAAYRQWGRGNHPAALNLGDCFAYTLARELNCPSFSSAATFLAPTSHQPTSSPPGPLREPCYPEPVQRTGRPLRAIEFVEESPDSTGQGCRVTPGRREPTESATETNRRHNLVREHVPLRVKWCGKSAPASLVTGRTGKPHPEQGQIGEESCPAR